VNRAGVPLRSGSTAFFETDPQTEIERHDERLRVFPWAVPIGGLPSDPSHSAGAPILSSCKRWFGVPAYEQAGPERLWRRSGRALRKPRRSRI